MRRAGAVLFIGASPFLIIAVSIGMLYGMARSALTEREFRVEQDLSLRSVQESRRAPCDWPPYGEYLCDLRLDPAAQWTLAPLPWHSLNNLQETLTWTASGCPFGGWVARLDVGFGNRHAPYIFGGIPVSTPIRERLLSTALAQDFLRGGGYYTAFHRAEVETRLHYTWHSGLAIQSWTPAALRDCIDTIDRLEAARPSLRGEIEVEHLLRCRDVLAVLRSGKDPEGLLKGREPGLRSIFSRRVMVAQLLRRMEESRDDLLALAERPWEEIWGGLEWSWHASAPVPPVFDYMDRCLLAYEGRAALRRSLLRTALAVAQYGVETGHFPERLEDLIPHYLPALPRCPLTGVVLSYRDGEVRSPEVDDSLRTWLVRRPEPAIR